MCCVQFYIYIVYSAKMLHDTEIKLKINPLSLLNVCFWQLIIPCLSLRPSWPALFLPQPNTAPDRERAKLWSPPAVIFARGIPARELRGWGNSLLGSPFPRPSWPLEFLPHVNSWPSKRKRTQNKIINCNSYSHHCQHREIWNIYLVMWDNHVVYTI